LQFPAGRYVLDGEIVIDDDVAGGNFDALSNRIHPAESRIQLLSRETPARYIAFDLLALGDDILFERGFAARREALEELALPGVELTPVVYSAAEAEDWLRSREGVVAKELAAPYRPGERRGMAKIKRVRTIDVVVVGWRPGREEGTVGSLILGLYDGDGELRVVGHTSGFRAAEKRSLVGRLAPYETGERGSADPSRWRSDRELEWIGVRPELVIEVTFDQVTGHRIRHGAKVQRWRDDRAPRDCSIDQLAG